MKVKFHSMQKVHPLSLQHAGGGISDIRKKLGDMLDVITPISESMISSVGKLSILPDSVTAEYGLIITAESNLFVVKAAGEASLKVTFAWSPGKKERTDDGWEKQETDYTEDTRRLASEIEPLKVVMHFR
jgi:hypothetical protein